MRAILPQGVIILILDIVQYHTLPPLLQYELGILPHHVLDPDIHPTPSQHLPRLWPQYDIFPPDLCVHPCLYLRGGRVNIGRPERLPYPEGGMEKDEDFWTTSCGVVIDEYFVINWAMAASRKRTTFTK